MTPQRFENLLSLVGPRSSSAFPIFPNIVFRFFNKNVYSKQNAVEIDSFFTLSGKKFQWKQIIAELAGIFVECSFRFISRLKAYDRI